MNPDIKHTIQKTKQYWYEDGFSELGAAAVFALVAGVFGLEALAPEGSLLAVSSAITLPVAVIGGIWLVGRVVNRAKQRFVYPRSGYVVYHKPKGQRRALGILAAVSIAMVVAFYFASSNDALSSMQWVPLFTASVIGLFLLFIGVSVGLVRYFWLAIVSVAAGAVAAYSFPDPTSSSAAYFAAMAGAMALSGAITLYRYLHGNDAIDGASAASEAK